jgi:hypothetical protein
MFVLFSFGQTRKEYVLKDNSNSIKANPYQNQLDALYHQPDSGEIFFVPGIVPPKLYALGKNSMDTIFLKYNAESVVFYNKTMVEYIDETDSTLWNNLDHVRFDVYINWDGEVFYIKASNVIGKFDKKKWIKLWNNIYAIPSREEGILNEYRFSLPIIKKHSN